MIILLGASGYVGTAFSRYLASSGRMVRGVSRHEVDYTDADQLAALLSEVKPEFLINAAGYSGKPNVDACELHKADCLAGNAVLPGVIAKACRETGTRWGHVSSGCIYTGQRPDGSGFTETDSPNFCFRTDNCSFYSGTKALGEEVLAGAEQCYIWRLRIPFNHEDGPRNYLSKLMRYDRLLDVRNSFSQLDEFVAAAVACFDQQVPFGTYNLTNPGSLTTREVVELIRGSGVAGEKDFRFFESEKQFMQIAAETPRSNCVLDVSKAQSVGLHLSGIEEAICEALANWQAAGVLP